MSIPTFSTVSEDPLSGEIPVLEMGCPDRYLTPKEALEVWANAFGTGLLEPHQMKGYRTVMGWRVTRAIAVKKGALHMDQRLSDLNTSDWETPKTDIKPTSRFSITPDVGRWGVQDLLARNGGVALLPRPDTAQQHAALVGRLAEAMSLQRGSKDYPRLGHYGLHGLTHEHTILEFWPDQHEMLAFEDKVIDQIQGLVLKWSRRRIQTHLRDMFDLTLKETGGLIALATEEARIEATQEVETTRAIMVGRVEDYIDRMRENGDSANEMKGIKVLCAIHGLQHTNTEDTEKALIGVIAKVASDHAQGVGSTLRIAVDDGDNLDNVTKLDVATEDQET